ncbi:hypothetical protein M5585_13945 [Serratia ureilytica]
MIDLLPLTLEGNEPVEWQGETPQLRWRWQGKGCWSSRRGSLTARRW